MNKFKFIPDDEYFQKIRFNTIGASDIPIILGISTFKTPFDLWQEKTGKVEPWRGNNYTSWGHKHEVNILSSYVEDTENSDIAWVFELDFLRNKYSRGDDYIPATLFYPYTEFIHPDVKWAIAHPDLIDLKNNVNIEAKSGRRFANMKRGDMDGFDPDDPQGIPLKYYVQLQWQMMCAGMKNSQLRALIDTSDLMIFNIESNIKIQEKLLEMASRFKYCMEKDKPPMPINKYDIEKLFPEVHEKTAYLVGSESEFAIKMKERKKFLSEKEKKIKSEIDDINDALFVLIGSNKYLYDENNEKICSQVFFESEYIKSAKEIEKIDNQLYLTLKEKGIIEKKEIRYVR